MDLTYWATDRTGAKYLLLVVDHFSKKAWGAAIADKTQESVFSALENILLEVQPKRMLSDNGSEFKNDLVKSLLTTNFAQFVHGAPYHSETNGGAERVNKTISNFVRNAACYLYICKSRRLIIAPVRLIGACVILYTCRSSPRLTIPVTGRRASRRCWQGITTDSTLPSACVRITPGVPEAPRTTVFRLSITRIQSVPLS